MPHDAKGRELKAGDRVMVPMIVVGVIPNEDFCNVHLQTVATMPHYKWKSELSAINTTMVLRAEPGDSLEYTTAPEPTDDQVSIGTRIE